MSLWDTTIYPSRPKYAMKWSTLNEILLKPWVASATWVEAARVVTLIIELKGEEGILHGVQKHPGSRVSVQDPFWAPAPAFQGALPALEAPDANKVPLFLSDLTWKRIDKSTRCLTSFTWATIKSVTYFHTNFSYVSGAKYRKIPALSQILYRKSLCGLPSN